MHRSSFDFYYSQKYLAEKSFGGALNDMGHIRAGGPLAYIGIQSSSYMLISRGLLDHPGSISYAQLLPQKISVNDTATVNIGGFNFGLTLWGYDFFKSNAEFDLLFNVGFNTGRLKFTNTVLGNQKNPYFSPKAMFGIRILMAKIVLHFQVSYEYDISSQSWRPMKSSGNPLIDFEKTSLSGLNLQLGIGYVRY